MALSRSNTGSLLVGFAVALALTHTLAVALISVVVPVFTQVGERMRRGERLDRCHPSGWGVLFTKLTCS